MYLVKIIFLRSTELNCLGSIIPSFSYAFMSSDQSFVGSEPVFI